MSGGTYRRPTTCGYRIGLRPLGGACPLRPLRLLWPSVSAAGDGHLHSKPFSSPMVHKRQFPQKQAIKKYPAASCEVFCGAPCGSKPEHFCVSERHRHHTAALPEVMPVVPPREDKRGVLKHQGAFAAYPRFANWAAVFHSPLDISPSLFFRLIAEQPTSPYPGGITESKSKHGTCLVQ